MSTNTNPQSICFFLEGKTIREAFYNCDRNGDLSSFYLDVEDKRITIHPEIVFHGNQEHPAEVKLVVEMITK